MADTPQQGSGKEESLRSLVEEGSDKLHTEVGNGIPSKSSIFFSGQIPEAIAAAKSEQKTLIVYIAGENEDCKRLDQITWQDCKVQEVLLQQFVTLHLWHRSTDAAHFSAMFPYHEIPTIAVISHKGTLLKQHGGYVTPAELLLSLEQSVAMQNTAAMVAALASASAGSSTPLTIEDEVEKVPCKPGTSNSEAASSALYEDSGTSSASAAQINNNLPLEDGTDQLGHILSDQEHLLAKDAIYEVPDGDIKPAVDAAMGNALVDKNMSQSTAASGVLETLAQNTYMKVTDSKLSEKKEKLLCTKESVPKSKQNVEAVLLQVRLTNGENIRKIFNSDDRLAVVKEFVDKNRTDGNNSYSLAVFYPRHLFSQEDMQRTLWELSLEDRATLILVTNKLQETPITSAERSARAPNSQLMDASNSGGIWKILSYLNPFSYFTGGIANTNNGGSGSSSWQYEPDPTLLPSSRQSTERQGSIGPDIDRTNIAKRKTGGNNGPQDRNWGSNIHTLQHNDDDDAFKQGNAFWNGNSTQYGGDDSKRQ